LIFELDARACDQVFHGGGHEHFSRPGECGRPRTDVYGDPAHMVSGELDLSRVQPAADMKTERLHAHGDRMGASDCACWAVEGREKAIARGVHLSAAAAFQLSADNRVVTLQEVAPCAVAELGGARGGVHNVREQDGR
jgi:hypothetical protein